MGRIGFIILLITLGTYFIWVLITFLWETFKLWLEEQKCKRAVGKYYSLEYVDWLISDIKTTYVKLTDYDNGSYEFEGGTSDTSWKMNIDKWDFLHGNLIRVSKEEYVMGMLK
jgi:hypothetical protein